MIDIDANLGNTDWVKSTRWDLPTAWNDFLAAIGGPERLAHFMTLPAADAMPRPLRKRALQETQRG